MYIDVCELELLFRCHILVLSVYFLSLYFIHAHFVIGH
jgi:hypothetical protein